MSEVKHTPLPWAFEARDKINGSDVERPWIGQLERNDFSALICGNNADHAWANAAFIIQAVNSHYAFIEALKKIKRESHKGKPDPDVIYEAACAALDLAKGEQA